MNMTVTQDEQNSHNGMAGKPLDRTPQSVLAERESAGVKRSLEQVSKTVQRQPKTLAGMPQSWCFTTSDTPAGFRLLPCRTYRNVTGNLSLSEETSIDVTVTTESFATDDTFVTITSLVSKCVGSVYIACREIFRNRNVLLWNQTHRKKKSKTEKSSPNFTLSLNLALAITDNSCKSFEMEGKCYFHTKINFNSPEYLTLSRPSDVNYILDKSAQSAVLRNLRFRKNLFLENRHEAPAALLVLVIAESFYTTWHLNWIALGLRNSSFTPAPLPHLSLISRSLLPFWVTSKTFFFRSIL